MSLANWAMTACLNHTTEETLTEEKLVKSTGLKEKAAEVFQTSRVFHKYGWHTDKDFFIEVWNAATSKDFLLHEMTNADLKKFKWEMADREAWINEGFGEVKIDPNTGKVVGFEMSVGNNFRVLQAKLKRLPGGDEVYRRVNEIAGYHRRETVQNKNRIINIEGAVKSLGKELGVDLSRLGELETALQNAKTKKERDEILYGDGHDGNGGIKKFLGAFNTENARTAAGDLYLSIRDVMEGKNPADLRRSVEVIGQNGEKTTQLVPWSTNQQKQFTLIRDNWQRMRKDLSKVLINALRVQKEFLSNVDRTEGGRRRLTEYIDKLEAYIKTIEFQSTDANDKSGRAYDIDRMDLDLYGLSPDKFWKINTDLGYMPHYLLEITQHMKDMTKFAHDTTERRSAFDAFQDMIKLMEGDQGVINRVKSRADFNQEYYSRNPLFFLQKYVHEVTTFNKTKQLELIMQDMNNMLLRAGRVSAENAKKDPFSDPEAMDMFIEGAMKVLHTMEVDLVPVDSNKGNGFLDKTARLLNSFQFMRLMSGNTRSAMRNRGQFLQERIKMGYASQAFARRYFDETDIKVQYEKAAESFGLIWAKGDVKWSNLNTEWQNALAGTKGSVEEGSLLPGLKEIVTDKGERKIILDDPSLMDKLIHTVEAVAIKGSYMHSMVETINRQSTFKAGFARAHSNLSQAPDWYIEQMMGREVGSTTTAQRDVWIVQQSGKLAYGITTDIHYEYSKHEKADIIKGPVGKIIGQFQHYRFSLFNFQHNILKRGMRDLRTGEVLSGEHSRQMIRMGMTHTLIDAASKALGLGFINILANDNLEFVKNLYSFFTAERNAEGELTSAGLEQTRRAMYGGGTFSLMGPSVGWIVEFGTIMNFWEVNSDQFISYLASPSNEAETNDDSDRNYRLMRLLNVQAARTVGPTWEAFANGHLVKALMTETGLYVNYKDKKQSQEFFKWLRDVTGTKTTGRKPEKRYPSMRRRRRSSNLIEEPF